MESQAELVDGLRKGNLASFKRLFDEKYTLFFCFIRGLVKDECLAEDITQNIFMKTWVNRAKLDSTKSIHNYLYVLARNEVRDYFKTKSSKCFQQIEDFHRVIIEDFEGTIDAQCMRDNIHKIVCSMPNQRRKIYLMSREENFSNKEIAQKLNLSVRTVERHLFLALQTIRKCLPAFYLCLYFCFYESF